MAEDARTGEDWTEAELDLIVADYFAMLALELAGRGCSKIEHNRALQRRIPRSKGSIEFKHQNLSAVLGLLGRPTIRGYRPRYNVQGALFDAVDRFLARDEAPFALAAAAEPPLPRFDAREIELVALPTGESSAFAASPRIERLVRKWDPAARDARNRAVGEAGEGRIVDFERARLAALDRPDLARKVRWVSKEDGDGAGYDILSFSRAGDERLIEVKTTLGAAATPFFISRNEATLASERPDAFRLYRLHDFAQRPKLFEVAPPLEALLRMETEVWRARVG